MAKTEKKTEKTEKKREKRFNPILEFWRNLFGRDVKLVDGSWVKTLPLNPERRLRMLQEEIAGLEHVLKSRSEDYEQEGQTDQYEALEILVEALKEAAEKQKSFPNIDLIDIDRRLFELCRNAAEAIEHLYYVSADWSMRALFCGLEDIRQDITFAEEYSTTGESSKEVLNELENRERQLKRFVDLAVSYSRIAKHNKILEDRRSSFEEKRTRYAEEYEKFRTFLQSAEGQQAVALLKRDPNNPDNDKNAAKLQELTRIQSKAWVSYEVEETVLRDLNNVISESEQSVATLRANVRETESMRKLVESLNVTLERTMDEVRANRKELYASLKKMQATMEHDRMEREAFENSDLYRDVANNDLNRALAKIEREEARHRFNEQIRSEVMEKMKLLAEPEPVPVKADNPDEKNAAEKNAEAVKAVNQRNRMPTE